MTLDADDAYVSSASAPTTTRRGALVVQPCVRLEQRLDVLVRADPAGRAEDERLSRTDRERRLRARDVGEHGIGRLGHHRAAARAAGRTPSRAQARDAAETVNRRAARRTASRSFSRQSSAGAPVGEDELGQLARDRVVQADDEPDAGDRHVGEERRHEKRVRRVGADGPGEADQVAEATARAVRCRDVRAALEAHAPQLRPRDGDERRCLGST